MTQNEMMLKGIELKLDRLLDIFNQKEEEKRIENKIDSIDSEWITLTQAWRMLGSYKLSTMRARLDLQPKNGKGTMIGKNKCWTRAEVMEWLKAVTPEQREAYKKKYANS